MQFPNTPTCYAVIYIAKKETVNNLTFQAHLQLRLHLFRPFKQPQALKFLCHLTTSANSYIVILRKTFYPIASHQQIEKVNWRQRKIQKQINLYLQHPKARRKQSTPNVADSKWVNNKPIRKRQKVTRNKEWF